MNEVLAKKAGKGNVLSDCSTKPKERLDGNRDEDSDEEVMGKKRVEVQVVMNDKLGN